MIGLLHLVVFVVAGDVANSSAVDAAAFAVAAVVLAVESIAN